MKIELEVEDAKLLTRTLAAAKQLCEIYFNIAAEAIGEDEVRKKRDQILDELKSQV